MKAAAVEDWRSREGSASAEGRQLRPGQQGDEEDAQGEGGYLAHVPLPSEKDIEKAILQKRKQELLARYSLGPE